jgi:hypothetical protein
MNYIKCSLFVICIILVGVLICNYNKIDEDITRYRFNTYFDTKSIVDDSTDIVKGKVVSIKNKKIDISLDESEKKVNKYVVLDVKINESVKGKYNKDDIVKVKYPVELQELMRDKLIKDKEYLLFLVNYDTFNKEIPMSLLNIEQSIINFEDSKNYDNEYDQMNLFKDIPNDQLIDYIKSLL